MSDFFDDDHETAQEKNQHGIDIKNLWIFIGAILLVGLLILIIAESSKSTKVDVKRNLDKYKKSRQASGTQPRRIRERIEDDDSRSKERIVPPAPKPGPTQHEKITPPIDDNKIVLSVVRVITETGFGSGTLLSRKGYFLTNAHVVRNSQFQFIYFSRNPKSPPEKYFLTAVAYKNDSLDLAVLKVRSTYGNASIDHLNPVKIGRSSSLKLGDEIYIYGYPGVGGQTITLTRGVISGFLQDFPSRIKTDANIASGNSGGGAFNHKGELIGIPTSKHIDKELTSQIGIVRPIDNIKRYISRFL